MTLLRSPSVWRSRFVVFEMYGGTSVLVDPGAGGIDASGAEVIDRSGCSVLFLAIGSAWWRSSPAPTSNTVLSARVLPK